MHQVSGHVPRAVRPLRLTCIYQPCPLPFMSALLRLGISSLTIISLGECHLTENTRCLFLLTRSKQPRPVSTISYILTMSPHSVTTWQLRTHYLATIRDGVGDRLLNVNSSLLNSHTYRAAGWGDVTSANANNIRRAYSPPIPTAALASGYFQAINRSNVRDDDGSVQRTSGMQLGIPEDDEDNASDLMAGGRRSPSIVDFRRRHGLYRKHGRRTRGQRSETPLGARQDDSSDLSDDSDDSERYGPQVKVRCQVRLYVLLIFW